MNVFDILGPVMIGPSSSHTAGAARIGRLAGIVLGEKPVRAEVYLHGSFAETYRGHGTDRAIVGGLLGFKADDERIREALKLAAREGLTVNFHKDNLGDVHPNTTKLIATGRSGKTMTMVASSVGGGDIKVSNLLGFPVDFSGEFYTLIIPHHDRPGTIGAVTNLLAGEGINIAQMRVTRERQGSEAIMIIETDQPCHQGVVEKIKAVKNILSVTLVNPL